MPDDHAGDHSERLAFWFLTVADGDELDPATLALVIALLEDDAEAEEAILGAWGYADADEGPTLLMHNLAKFAAVLLSAGDGDQAGAAEMLRGLMRGELPAAGGDDA